eukprot:1756230-Prymnesium_polylepis.1
MHRHAEVLRHRRWVHAVVCVDEDAQLAAQLKVPRLHHADGALERRAKTQPERGGVVAAVAVPDA